MTPSIRSAVAWTVGVRLASLVLQLGSVVVTARFMAPEEYGDGVLALTIMTLAFFVSEAGIAAAVVNRGAGITPNYLNVAFWIGGLAGLAVFAIIVGLALPLSAVYATPHLAGLLLVGACSFLVTQSAVPVGLLMHRQRFRQLAAADMIQGVVNVVVVIGAAVGGLGAYSLVLGSVLGSAVHTPVVMVMSRWHPAMHFNGRDAQHVWQFSKGMLGFDLTTFAATNIDRMLLPLYLQGAAYGTYVRASSLIALPSAQAATVVGRVLYPILTAGRENLEVFKKTLVRALHVAFALGAYLSSYLIVSAGPLIGTLLGGQWTAAIAPFSVLAIGIPFVVARNLSSAVFQAKSRTSLLFGLSSVFLISNVIVVVLIGGQGSTVVAAALVATQVIASALSLQYMNNLAGVRWRELARPASRVIVVAFVAASVSAPVPLLTPSAPDAWALMLTTACWLLAFLPLCYFLDRETFSLVIRQRRSTRVPAA